MRIFVSCTSLALLIATINKMTMVKTDGNINTICDGIVPVPCSLMARASANPKIKLAKAPPMGVPRPKMFAASPMKPRLADIFSVNMVK